MDFSRCCAIVGSASFDADHFLAERAAGRFSLIAAADAGFASLESVGVRPDIVIGDFDSLGYVPDFDRVERHPVMKDASDLELALQWAEGRGCTAAVVYGALGGRLDQTMATQQVLVRFARLGMCAAAVGEGFIVAALSSGVPGCGVSDACDGQGAADDTSSSRDAGTANDADIAGVSGAGGHRPCGVRPPACASLGIAADVSGIVSAFAIGGDAHGVSERGLLYEIEDAVLPCASSLGLSNELVGRAAHIEVARGDVLVFLPACPLAKLG